MKQRVMVALVALFGLTGTLQAGSLKDPIIEKDLIIEQTKAGSSSGSVALVALTWLVMVSVAASR